MTAVILWQRLDSPGSECALLEKTISGWKLSGFAAFLDNHENCGLGYTVSCDESWQTQSVKVFGHIGISKCDYEIEIAKDAWCINGIEHPEAKGCIDIDMGFSPSTNLLPIRRLSLDKGESAKIKAAWLQFPNMTLVPSEQIYTRETDTQYRYESLQSNFICTLETNSDGFVTSYPGYWNAEGAT